MKSSTPSQDANQKDITKGAGANLAGFIIRLGARIPFLLLIGHLYGSSRFGVYVFGVTYVETLAFIAIFGFKSSIFKFLSPPISDNNLSDVVHISKNCLAFCLLIASALVLLTFAAQPLLSRVFGPEIARFTVYLSPAIFLYTGTEILLTVTRAFRKMRYEVFVRSLMEPYSLLLLAFAFYMLGIKESGLLYAYLLMSLLSFLLAVYAFSRMFTAPDRHGFKLDLPLIKKITRFSAPTALHDILNFSLQRMDVYLLAGLAPTSTVGLYGMALQIATTVKKIKQSFDPIVVPVISQITEGAGINMAARELARVSYIIACIQMIIIVLLSIYGGALMSLFGSEFAAAGLMLTLLVIGDLFVGTVGISEYFLLFKRPKINPMITGAALILHLGLSLVLIDMFGGNGAALSVMLTFCFMSFTRLLSAKHILGVLSVDKRLLRPVLAGAASWVCLMAFTHILPNPSFFVHLFAVILAISLYLAILYFMSTNTERKNMNALVLRIVTPKN